MNKSVIISIKPKWVEKILNGKKTIEIRKSIPKCGLPIDVYIYCTKGKPFLMVGRNDNKTYLDNGGAASVYSPNHNYIGNGKIVAKFTLNKVDKLEYEITDTDDFQGFTEIAKFNYGELEDKCCLKDYEIDKYLEFCSGYAWHINNLEIFDEPMKLSEFYRNVDDFVDARPCNCGKKCKYESYDLQEYQSICGIDYDGESCPFVKIQKAPQSWCYCYKEN